MTDQILKLLGNKRGYEVLRDPLLNKGSAFTLAERAKLGLEGILPPQVNEMATQAQRSYAGIQRHAAPIDKYVALAALLNRNEHLFYRVVCDHIEEFMPIIYTPTVGQATREYSHVFQHSRGVWITPASRGGIGTALRNAAGERRIRLIVVTDNESILGIGDQGAGGIGISIGKLSLYTAAAGVHPAGTLPVSIDAGTDNKALLDDPLYLGRRHPRLRGAEYDALIDEFVQAVKTEFPGAVLQWEDFRKENALTIMNKYRKVLPSFNDDIQGTGAVALAGLLGACRVLGRKLTDQRVVVFGAGAGGLGIARQIRAGMVQLGLDDTAIRERIAVLDSRGLIVSDNEMRDAYKSELAWSQEQARRVGLGNAGERGLDDVVEHYKPTVLIGASGQPGSFPGGADPPRCCAGRTADHLPAVESQRQHRGATGRHRAMDRRPRDRRRRKSVQTGCLRRRSAADRAGQQRLHLPRARPRRTARRSARSDRQHDQRRRRFTGRLSDGSRNRGRSAVSVGATAARRGARRGDRRHQAGGDRRRRDEGHRRPRSRGRGEHVGAGVPRLRLTRHLAISGP